MRILSLLLISLVSISCIVPDTRVRVGIGVVVPVSTCISCHSSSTIIYYNTHGYRPHYSSHYRAFPNHRTYR